MAVIKLWYLEHEDLVSDYSGDTVHDYEKVFINKLDADAACEAANSERREWIQSHPGSKGTYQDYTWSVCAEGDRIELVIDDDSIQWGVAELVQPADRSDYLGEAEEVPSRLDAEERIGYLAAGGYHIVARMVTPWEIQ